MADTPAVLRRARAAQVGCGRTRPVQRNTGAQAAASIHFEHLWLVAMREHNLCALPVTHATIGVVENRLTSSLLPDDAACLKLCDTAPLAIERRIEAAISGKAGVDGVPRTIRNLNADSTHGQFLLVVPASSSSCLLGCGAHLDCTVGHNTSLHYTCVGGCKGQRDSCVSGVARPLPLLCIHGLWGVYRGRGCNGGCGGIGSIGD
jgi:hypothetical protein